MRLRWWSRLEFESGRRRMAISYRSLSGQLPPLVPTLTRTFERRLCFAFRNSARSEIA